MGISPRSKSLITRSLRILAKERKLVLAKQGRRLSITLASEHIALLGRISAGKLFQGKDRFALMVQGNSMVEDGILDGDIIVCRRSNVAQEGDIVVALIDQSNATLKRISYRIPGLITLVPANPQFKPRAYAPERATIQGIYMGLIRIHERNKP
jgi:SOS-response transcriptional repressor LexA